MKGEFTRMTQRRSSRFSGVRLQQGRVQLDADFNEQVDIGAHRDRVTTLDAIGPNGVPDVGGGFEVSARVGLAAIDASGSSALAVGDSATILASSDGGATWTAEAGPAGHAGDLHAVALVPAATAFAVGSGPAILVRGAGTWTSQALPAATTGAMRAVSFVDAQRGWAVGDGGQILATANGGGAWAKQAVPAGTVETLHAVHFFDAQRGWAVGDGARILATTTGGTSWQAQQAPLGIGAALRGVRFASAERGYAVGDGATILATADGGTTWVARPPAGVTATLRAVDVEAPAIATAVGDGPLALRTTDGGLNWTALPPPAGAGDLSAIRNVGGGILVAGDLSTVGRAPSVAPPAWQPVTLPAAARDLAISAGRIYVDGVLCENERATRYRTQPDLPLPPVPKAAGRYVAYLDVWERHLTALERPELREVALGGPDTATRTQTVWQLRLDGPVNAAGCAALPADFAPSAPAPGDGRMRARGAPAPLGTTECMVPAQGGYRRLENQLYRVEVVAASTSGSPEFAWSRDNAAMLARLDRIDPGATNDRTKLVASDPGRDAVIGFAGARFVEISDERRPLRGEPGALYEVDSVLENTITIKHPTGVPPQRAQFGAEPTLRRWDGRAALTAGGWIALEDGVEVEFAAGSYQVGDFWAFPARTLTAEVEWPTAGGVPTFQPREGIEHAYCALALADLDAGGRWTVFSDCRPLFTALTGQTRMAMAGGDGQEFTPPLGASGRLPYPLEVAVMNGRRPLPGAVVRFRVLEGGGTLGPVGGAAVAGPLDVPADVRGIAACEWAPVPGAARHRVVARLLDRAGQPLDAPLHFNARTAAGGGAVGVCTVEARPGDDLQGALDQLSPDGGELCLAAGVYELPEPLRIKERRVTISGRGPATILRGETPGLVVAEDASHLTIRMLRFEANESQPGIPGMLFFERCRHVKVIDCEVVAPDVSEGPGGFGLACIASFDESEDGDSELLVERCLVQAGDDGVGILVNDCARAQLVANDISIAPVMEGLRRDLVRRAVEAMPLLLTATFRAEPSAATVPIGLGDADLSVNIVRDERTAGAWRALGLSLQFAERRFDATRAIAEFRNLLERDLDADELFGRRSERELDELAASGAVEAALIERERGVMAVAAALRTIRDGIRVTGPRVSRVEIVRNVIGPAQTGVNLGDQAGGDDRDLTARVLVSGNVIRCMAPEGGEILPCAIMARNTSSLTVTETRAELGGAWAADPETARRNKDVRAIVVEERLGPFLAVRHSDIEGFPVGVTVTPSQPVIAGQGDQQPQMWIVAETMCLRAFRAVSLHAEVREANNHHSF